MKRPLVIPTNRPQHLRDFLAAWEGRGGWDGTILIEDAPSRTPDLTPLVDRHYSHAEIDAILGADSWIISRRDSAVRCFGFLAAYHTGCEHVLTLDDDCLPDGGGELDFFGRHIDRMNGHRRWVSTAPWLRVRGLPYQNTGRLKTVVANVGLWTGHPDLDGVASLMNLAQNTSPSYGLPHANWVAPHGQYLPVCGMNLSVRRDALPLFYFPLMGAGQPFRRFDDIWSGVIAKRICDHIGWHISVGEPFVHHSRASDPFVNLVKESPGVAANETLWEKVDWMDLDRDIPCPVESMRRLGEGLRGHFPEDAYLSRLGEAMGVWARLMVEKPKGL